MQFFDQVSRKWNAFCTKIQPVLSVLKKIGYYLDLVMHKICDIVFILRKLFLLIPVVYAAVKLALRNMDILPDQVGINFLSSGEFQYMIPKNIAVYGPLAITAFCLLLMLISRKTLNPWIVSVFTLILPLFIWISNSFPF